MNGPRPDEALAAAGLDASELAAKSRLFERVLEALGPAGTGRKAAWWVPGRLEVFGTHTDYAGGRTLVAAVPRGFAVASIRRADGHVRVVDALHGHEVTFDPGRHAARYAGWRRYVQVVLGRLERNFPGASLAADIVFASDLPRAAGMSSSSALVISVATALAYAAALPNRSEWQANLSGGRLDEAAYYACLENGRTFGSLAGDSGVGTHGGSEDHAAILMGRARTVSGFAFVPMRALDTARVSGEWAVVVASSGVHADKTGTVMERYNRLSEGASVLLSLWNRSGPECRSLGEVVSRGDAAIEALERLIECSNEPRWTRQALADRLRQFVQEDARIPEALRAFDAADAGRLADLAAGSQHDSERLLGNQVPETAALVRLAMSSGALAARSFGAGFGGSAWAVVDAGEATPFIGRWLSAYRREFPSARGATAFVATPGPALTRVI